jgi:hypothetical protein
MATEPSKYKIQAPPGSRSGFFLRLKDAAEAAGVWFPRVSPAHVKAAKEMVSFPLNDSRLRDLVAALNTKRDECERQARQAEADRDEILRQVKEQQEQLPEEQTA